ncbi:MAG: hypothetical protein J6129_05305 [Bacteroidaceae bacterium]|nr:hypothetical protein [Bacteroidaceae bacterium]
MKTKILTIALLAAILCGHATPIDEAPSIPPTNVLNAIERIENAYGIKEKKSITEKRSGVDNAIESVVIIFPFECPNGLGIMADTKEAFIKDKDLGFQFGVYEPGQGTKFHTYTGDKPSENILTRESLDQGFYYINVKNNDNPTLRDFCGVQWQAFGDKVKGKIFLITSLRPDLVEKNAQKSDPFKMFFGEDGIVSNLPSSLAVDTCLAETNISDYLQGMEEYKQGMKQYKIDMEKFRKEMGKVPHSIDVAGWSPSVIYKGTKVVPQLNAYKQLLEMQQNQINTLEQQYKDNVYNLGERRHINKRLRKLHKQAQKTSNEMQKLIKKLK